MIEVTFGNFAGLRKTLSALCALLRCLHTEAAHITWYSPTSRPCGMLNSCTGFLSAMSEKSRCSRLGNCSLGERMSNRKSYKTYQCDFGWSLASRAGLEKQRTKLYCTSDRDADDPMQCRGQQVRCFPEAIAI